MGTIKGIKLELALTDDISSASRAAFDANSKGVDLLKQASSQFNLAVLQAQKAETMAKEGEDKAKFLGLDSKQFSTLKKDASDLFKMAQQNLKKSQ